MKEFEEYFVPFDIAKIIYNLGFRNDSLSYYINGYFQISGYNTLKQDDIDKLNENKDENIFYSAPLLTQVIDWIREEHLLWVETPMYIVQEGKLNGCYAYKSIIKESMDFKEHIRVVDECVNTIYNAQVIGILKALELIKNKHN